MKKNSLMMSALVVTGMALAACSSGMKKASLPEGANPTEQIAQLNTDLQEGYSNHYDLLAAENFRQSEKYLRSAEERMKDGDSQEKILSDVAFSRAYMDEAKTVSERRRPQVEPILMAREQALESGVRDHRPSRKTLKDIDDEVRSNADEFSSLSAQEISELQNQYLKIQLDAIKEQKIGKARQLVETAKSDRASRRTPTALRAAETALVNADNMINVNRNNPEAFEEAVQAANERAEFLTAVLAATRSGSVDEQTATRVVMQERQIGSLQGRVGSLRGQLGEVNQEVGSMSQALEDREQALAAAKADREQVMASAQAERQMREALDKARRQFSSSEADVYQQGDKLLIRLKAIHFPVGSANLPSTSMALLSKVRSVAEELGPQAVVVEGHTDATGSPAINSRLSQERAATVADYLSTSGIDSERIQAVGFGFERPIASNRSSEGRAQNRRVDILITPGDLSVQRGTSSVEESKEVSPEPARR